MYIHSGYLSLLYNLARYSSTTAKLYRKTHINYCTYMCILHALKGTLLGCGVFDDLREGSRPQEIREDGHEAGSQVLC